jgi:hypothetical protein
MADLTTVRKRPCPSCPYRRDVPSGIWSAEEYAKLPKYDGDTLEQARSEAFGLFLCHSRRESVCAGWAGCHDMAESLAVRMSRRDLDIDAVLGYVSPVPLFSSGAEAAAHGMRDIAEPGPAARRKVRQLQRLISERDPWREDA